MADLPPANAAGAHVPMDANVLNGLMGNVNTLIANLTATRNVEYPTEDKLRKRAKDLVKKFTGDHQNLRCAHSCKWVTQLGSVVKTFPDIYKCYKMGTGQLEEGEVDPTSDGLLLFLLEITTDGSARSQI